MATDIEKRKAWDFDETFGPPLKGLSPVTEKVIDIISGMFCVERERVQPSVRLDDDLRFDGLDRLDLVIALDEQFGIEISDEAGQNLKTCGDVVTLVKRLIQERGA